MPVSLNWHTLLQNQNVRATYLAMQLGGALCRSLLHCCRYLWIAAHLNHVQAAYLRLTQTSGLCSKPQLGCDLSNTVWSLPRVLAWHLHLCPTMVEWVEKVNNHEELLDVFPACAISQGESF